MGWSNLLKNLPGPLSEVAISAKASEWSGGRCRGREGPSAKYSNSAPQPTVVKTERYYYLYHSAAAVTPFQILLCDNLW